MRSSAPFGTPLEVDSRAKVPEVNILAHTWFAGILSVCQRPGNGFGKGSEVIMIDQKMVDAICTIKFFAEFVL